MRHRDARDWGERGLTDCVVGRERYDGVSLLVIYQPFEAQNPLFLGLEKPNTS